MSNVTPIDLQAQREREREQELVEMLEFAEGLRRAATLFAAGQFKPVGGQTINIFYPDNVRERMIEDAARSGLIWRKVESVTWEQLECRLGGGVQIHLFRNPEAKMPVTWEVPASVQTGLPDDAA
jgi:hypothetical protein